MGALTSKPQAYQGRPWEYDEVFALDLYDIFGTNIIVNTRGTSILRIIPRIHKNLNKFLITDKIRFSFDALTLQRILKPMINVYSKKTKSKKLITCTLRDMYPIISIFLNNTQQLFVFFGKFLNMHTTLSIYNIFSQLYTTNQITILDDAKQVNKYCNWINQVYPESMSSFNKYNTIILLNTNLRLELPIVHYYIQQLTIEKLDLKIFSLNSYKIGANTIEITSQELVKLYLGASKMIPHLKGPALLILGKNNSNLFKFIQQFGQKLQEFGVACNVLNTWLNTTQITNYLLQHTTAPIIIKYSINNIIDTKNTSVIMINTTNYMQATACNSLYIGSHPNKQIYDFKIILPIKHYFEETGDYFNFQGVLQRSNRAIDNSEFFFKFYDILYLINQQIYNTFYKINYKKSTINVSKK